MYSIMIVGLNELQVRFTKNSYFQNKLAFRDVLKYLMWVEYSSLTVVICELEQVKIEIEDVYDVCLCSNSIGKSISIEIPNVTVNHIHQIRKMIFAEFERYF